MPGQACLLLVCLCKCAYVEHLPPGVRETYYSLLATYYMYTTCALHVEHLPPGVRDSKGYLLLTTYSTLLTTHDLLLITYCLLLTTYYLLLTHVEHLSPGVREKITPLHVHYMYTTCTLHVHYMHTTCTLHVEHLPPGVREKITLCALAPLSRVLGGTARIPWSVLGPTESAAKTASTAPRAAAGLALRTTNACEIGSSPALRY